jgi:endonuclease-3
MADAEKVYAILDSLYPDAKPGLHFKNSFELLIATILSAQSTDRQVNIACELLCRDYPDAATLASLPEDGLEAYIKSVGFFRVKGKNILAACRLLLEKHGGEVPQTMEALTALPGVGRKTANVVMSNAFGIPAIAVDTHVFRVSNRTGLTHAPDERKTEEQLMQVLPRERWSKAHHLIIYHGRQVCHARKPACGTCALAGECEYPDKL